MPRQVKGSSARAAQREKEAEKAQRKRAQEAQKKRDEDEKLKKQKAAEEEESRKRAARARRSRARSTVQDIEDVRIERQHNVFLKLRESTGEPKKFLGRNEIFFFWFTIRKKI